MDDHDIKIFHLLGTIEESLDPLNPTSFGSDRGNNNSVLSFPKLVNSALKKKTTTPFSSEKLEKHLISSTRKIRSLIKRVEETTGCLLLCPGEQRPQDSLFGFIDQYLGKEKFGALRWGDVWLKTGELKPWPLVKTKREVETFPSDPMAIDPEQVENVYLEKLVGIVRAKYGHFFSREDLLDDLELLKAVAKCHRRRKCNVLLSRSQIYPSKYRESNSHQEAVELILENRGELACSSVIGADGCRDLPEFMSFNDNPGRRFAYEDVYDKENSREMAIS